MISITRPQALEKRSNMVKPGIVILPAKKIVEKENFKLILQELVFALR